MPLMQNVAVCLHEMLLVLRADAAFGKDPASSLGGKLKISPSIFRFVTVDSCPTIAPGPARAILCAGH